MSVKRFIEFLECVVEDGDWEYSDGTRMSGDAAEFLASLVALRSKASAVCRVCNDKGVLDDAQAWDCGQQPSECPYCPGAVDRLLVEVGQLRTVNKELTDKLDAVVSAWREENVDALVEAE